MVDLRALGCALLLGGAIQGCAVDVAGIPGDAPVDAASPDLGPVDPPDLGVEPEDLGPVPDMPDCTPVDERCNGMDEDCDGRVDEDVVAAPCDGDDDGCMDGLTTCVDGGTTCEGDGATRAGEACDGLDADTVAEGFFACEDDALTCPDDCIPTGESCNQRDDDCDGSVDEEGACSDEGDDCRAVRRGDSLYLFCTDRGGGESSYTAEGECDRGQYDLARIDDDDERVFLMGESGGGNLWVGARTDRFDPGGRRNKDTWTWRPSNAGVDHDLWANDEPSGDGSCAHLRESAGGRLNDTSCNDQFTAYICEGVLLP